MLALPAAVAAQPSPAAEVRAAEAALEAAMAAGDAPALDRLLAPDFLFASASGTVGGRRDYVDGLTAPGHRMDRWQVSNPLFVQVGADTALIGGEALVRGADDGRPFAYRIRFTTAFARRDGRWLAVYSQTAALGPG